MADYDYSAAGAYYMTICAWNRESIFGDIVEGKMKLDEFVIMPNHMHGIIEILNSECRGEVTSPLKSINNYILTKLAMPQRCLSGNGIITNTLSGTKKN